uniref:ORF33 n=1 Tax=Spilarctia obliqua nucleopolyhedrovirus TaxID=1638618 RepID=A0A7G9U8A1_9ABAC|nr:ORF33 [Spilarctia obliqua nucleopolyhedrovirus]
MRSLLLLVVLALLSTTLARQALPDPLAPPPRRYGHLAGAPKLLRPRNFNAEEQKLQQCRVHLHWRNN